MPLVNSHAPHPDGVFIFFYFFGCSFLLPLAVCVQSPALIKTKKGEMAFGCGKGTCSVANGEALGGTKNVGS